MKYIFLLITWFCGSFGILSAQEIQVKSFQKLYRDLVRVPTMIASDSALFLCTSMEVRGVDNMTGCPSVRSRSMKPSADSAHFKTM